MTSTEQSILDALIELERAIESMPRTDPKPNLLPIFSRLDDLMRTLPSTSDPLLLHYLHKKSYQKARLLLEGRDSENAAGNCPGHTDNEGRAWPGRADSDTKKKDGGETPAR